MATPNNTPTGWVGWGIFAAAMMLFLGIFEAMVGLAAILKDDFFIVTQNSLLVFSFTTWGWINLILGIIIILAGVELLRGAMWARVIAVILAVFSLVANAGFVNAYPVWSILMMVVDVLVIYALTVHGGELRAE